VITFCAILQLFILGVAFILGSKCAEGDSAAAELGFVIVGCAATFTFLLLAIVEGGAK